MDAHRDQLSSISILDSSGQPVDLNALRKWIIPRIPYLDSPWQITRFPDGFSNLTYLIEASGGTCVIRTPPPGANIRSAHDMGREFRMLSALQPHFGQIPKPLACCEDGAVIGTPFFVMSKVEGRIYRQQKSQDALPAPGEMLSISSAAVDTLAKLHSIDVHATGLDALGHPEGYVSRQVNGWIRRYHQCATEDIQGLPETEAWLMDNMPGDTAPSVIHNDFKYDNLVFSMTGDARVEAVLDWEMSTIGDPLMDLGTMLAYWSEPGDDPALKPFNLTWLPGNLTRAQVIDRYAILRGIERPNLCFHYVFGCYKIGVIVQQIFARYQRGLSTDKRFAGLTHVLRATIRQAMDTIRTGHI
jgi:aminoglycoside phosphotransferase (APT) family kinase protein